MSSPVGVGGGPGRADQGEPGHRVRVVGDLARPARCSRCRSAPIGAHIAAVELARPRRPAAAAALDSTSTTVGVRHVARAASPGTARAACGWAATVLIVVQLDARPGRPARSSTGSTTSRVITSGSPLASSSRVTPTCAADRVLQRHQGGVGLARRAPRRAPRARCAPAYGSRARPPGWCAAPARRRSPRVRGRRSGSVAHLACPQRTAGPPAQLSNQVWRGGPSPQTVQARALRRCRRTSASPRRARLRATAWRSRRW